MATSCPSPHDWNCVSETLRDFDDALLVKRTGSPFQKRGEVVLRRHSSRLPGRSSLELPWSSALRT